MRDYQTSKLVEATMNEPKHVIVITWVDGRDATMYQGDSDEDAQYCWDNYCKDSTYIKGVTWYEKGKVRCTFIGLPKRGDPTVGRTADEPHRPLTCFVCGSDFASTYNFCHAHKEEYERLKKENKAEGPRFQHHVLCSCLPTSEIGSYGCKCRIEYGAAPELCEGSQPFPVGSFLKQWLDEHQEMTTLQSPSAMALSFGQDLAIEVRKALLAGRELQQEQMRKLNEECAQLRRDCIAAKADGFATGVEAALQTYPPKESHANTQGSNVSDLMHFLCTGEATPQLQELFSPLVSNKTVPVPTERSHRSARLGTHTGL